MQAIDNYTYKHASRNDLQAVLCCVAMRYLDLCAEDSQKELYIQRDKDLYIFNQIANIITYLEQTK